MGFGSESNRQRDPKPLDTAHIFLYNTSVEFYGGPNLFRRIEHGKNNQQKGSTGSA